MRKKVAQRVKDIIEYTLYVVLFIVLAVIVYILLVPRRPDRLRENFQETTKSSRSLYQTSSNFESDINTYFSTLSDNDDMLLMQACYQTPANDVSWIPKGCYTITNSTYSMNFEQVRSQIISQLQSFKAAIGGKAIQDPVYVLISQAPFMRDERGNVLTVQYNASSHDFNPVNVMRAGARVNDMQKPLYITYTIFFTKYYQNRSIQSTPYDVLGRLASNYKIKKDQCFLKCQGDNTDTYCGCLNRNVVSGDSQSYVSQCSSTPLPNANGLVDATKNVQADFYVMYKINKLASTIVSSGVFI